MGRAGWVERSREMEDAGTDDLLCPVCLQVLIPPEQPVRCSASVMLVTNLPLTTYSAFADAAGPLPHELWSLVLPRLHRVPVPRRAVDELSSLRRGKGASSVHLDRTSAAARPNSRLCTFRH